MNENVKKLDEWVKKEKANGLVDIKFFVGNLQDSTVDSFSKEALEILQSKRTACSVQGF